MTEPFADSAYPAVPYPGARPGCSFVHTGRTGWPVRPDPAAPSGWRVGATGADLDDWLTERDAAPLTERVPVLAYGSNACPAKITWLRDTLELPGPAVVLHARCTGLAAVWAAGLRVVDDQRAATLAALPGVVEEHAVWLATREQVRVLDVCEGRGVRYRLARLHTGTVELAGGAVVDGVLAYVGAGRIRHPLLVDGTVVRCAELSQSGAAPLSGVPADSDGITVTELHDDPDPADFPNRLFVYGTLQPGASAWNLVEGQVAGSPRRARLPGTLYDTGRGYPALRLGAGPGVSGWVLELATPATALSIMDEYEGPEYRRVRVVLPGGLLCWTYLWLGSVDGLITLDAPWPTSG